jgi:FKBP-type peptidyl-prolyl cis-trans isomerase FkpA
LLSTRWFSFVIILTFLLNGIILLIPSCKSSPERNSQVNNNSAPLNTNSAQKEDLIRNHQNIMRDESEEIDNYVTRHQLTVNITQTGLRYNIYYKGKGEKLASNDDYVTLNYKLSLLDGTQVYSSDSTGALKFQVGKSEIASGLQEGVKLMHEGDKAIFIVPSHLAYGLTGDGDQIKHYKSLVIDAELLTITAE